MQTMLNESVTLGISTKFLALYMYMYLGTKHYMLHTFLSSVAKTATDASGGIQTYHLVYSGADVHYTICG